jgi:hypothetical protein
MKRNLVQFSWNVLARTSALVLVGIFFSLPSSAFCMQPNPTVVCEFLNSDAVFVGTVISARDEPSMRKGDVAPEGWIYRLTVQRLFRGPNSKIIEVYTENASARFPLEVGKQYLLFAERFRGRLVIEGCGNSALVSEAKQSIEKLVKLEIPEDAVIEGRIGLQGIPDIDPHTPGVVVVIRGEGGTFRAVSDSNGWFHVNVPPGMYSAKVQQKQGQKITPFDLSSDNPDHFLARKGHCSELQFRDDSM